MKKESIDQRLEALRDRDRDTAPDSPPAGEFKAEFFRRAAALPKPQPAFRRVWKIAALFCISAIAAVLLLLQLSPPPKPINLPAVIEEPSVELIMIDKETDGSAPREQKTAVLTEPVPVGAKAEKETDRFREALAPAREVAAEHRGRLNAPTSTPMPVIAPAAKSRLKLSDASNHSAFGNVMVLRESAAYGRGDMPAPASAEKKFNTEEYKNFTENPFLAVSASPLSTFGADVDSASYTNLRRMIMDEKRRPPRDAVRIEECLNYFSYNYPAPEKDKMFNVAFEMDNAPWAPEHKLLLIGVQAKKIEKAKLPPSNFVFLIDDSGSMHHVMPLVIEAMTALTDQLRSQDKVSIVTYGGSVRRLAEGRSGSDKEEIKKVLAQLQAGGGTPGGAGIIDAYKLAHQYFIKGGNNRVVLITDGDFNVGVSSESDLVEMVEKERGSAIYLSTFGVGYGNFKDNKLKMLANKGNGNYSYLDNAREARHAMVNEMTGKMFTIAKDVKFQLEFNPEKVHSYRLLGYEFRKLADRDFNDDTKDSGEVGVGHQVTALYELVMADAPDEVKYQNTPKPDDLKYQARQGKASDELLTFKLRYQQPEEKAPSVLQEFTVRKQPKPGDNLGWASSVAEFALLLRDSEYKGQADFGNLAKRAKKFLGEDENGARVEFLLMVRNAAELVKK